MKALIIAALLLSLFSCSSNNTPPPPLYPIPGSGQWACGWCENPTNNLGTSFPMQPPPGIHYVYTPAQGLALGKTMTLTYTLTGNATLTPDASNDSQPATISLFIWQYGDNISCSGQFFSYRQFTKVRPNLDYGTHTISAIIDPSQWTGCGAGQPDSGFDTAVANAAFMGFTLGGQYFAGHGVDANGSATFTIDSFTVQ